jgi:hypothetical protein
MNDGAKMVSGGGKPSIAVRLIFIIHHPTTLSAPIEVYDCHVVQALIR